MIFDDPSQVPDTFWRVSAKALIFDDQNRLLVSKSNDGLWEIPGGGWEHGETLTTCLTRELAEELQVGVIEVGDIVFCFPSKTASGYHKLSVVARVRIDNSQITPTDDDLVEARYVDRDEFLSLRFQSGEAPVTDYVDHIWT